MKLPGFVLAMVVAGIGGCNSEPPLIHDNFKFNQLGFHPQSEKIAVIPAGDAQEFALISADGQEVYKGRLSAPVSLEP